MLDNIVITSCSFRGLGKAAQQRSIRWLSGDILESGVGAFAGINVLPRTGYAAPVRPFLHCGDWLEAEDGITWTVLTANVREVRNSPDDPYLWHEYEAVKGMHCVL